MICLGILAALVVNVALPVTSWRTMFMLAVVPAALLFLGGCLVLVCKCRAFMFMCAFELRLDVTLCCILQDYVHAGRGARSTAVPGWVPP
jgi:hypothetical protein